MRFCIAAGLRMVDEMDDSDALQGVMKHFSIIVDTVKEQKGTVRNSKEQFGQYG